jgi:hypothetical protein
MIGLMKHFKELQEAKRWMTGIDLALRSLSIATSKCLIKSCLIYMCFATSNRFILIKVLGWNMLLFLKFQKIRRIMLAVIAEDVQHVWEWRLRLLCQHPFLHFLIYGVMWVTTLVLRMIMLDCKPCLFMVLCATLNSKYFAWYVRKCWPWLCLISMLYVCVLSD